MIAPLAIIAPVKVIIDLLKPVLIFIHDTLGVSWGFSIVLLTVFVRALLAPLTVKQAAERLKVSADAIYDLCNSGKLPCQRVGNGRGTIRIRPADLDAIGKPKVIPLSALHQRRA